MKLSSSYIMAAAALSLLDPALLARQDELVMGKEPRRIPPPPRYRDTTCPQSSMRPPEPMPVRDAGAVSAAEAKRARKAAARLKAQR